jgi:hypothetical protein
MIEHVGKEGHQIQVLSITFLSETERGSSETVELEMSF